MPKAKVSKPKGTVEAVEPVETYQEPNADDVDLLAQIDAEYIVSHKYMLPKIQKWYARLKLYNNQKRDESAVGDPLMFTIQNTVLASLYDDRLMVKFGAREEGDAEVAENLNDVAEFDYDEMEKDELDYDWMWDTCFFGRGLMLMGNWDPDLMVPSPEVLDPLKVLRDPKARSVNGNRKRQGAAKFMGWFGEMTRDEMEDANFKNIDNASKDSGYYALVKEAEAARADAQGHQDTSKQGLDTGDNVVYEVLVWMTMRNGKRVLVITSGDRKVVHKERILDTDYFPIVDRPLFPIAHDWDGVSIPDLTEDKQRARSVLINLGIKHSKANLYPMYLFDSNKITNRANLGFELNKWIPVDGAVEGAARPLQKDAMSAEVRYILDSLDVAAQRATATPESQQGSNSSDKKTLGEIQIVSSKVGVRYSLTAKVFGWSERRFWKMWYDLYKKYFDKTDEKRIRISGMFHNSWRALTRENLIGDADPDIKIESRIISEQLQQMEFSRISAIATLAFAGQEGNRRYFLKRLARLAGMKNDEVDRGFPPTIDELIAEDENTLLAQNKIVPPSVDENPVEHLIVHAKCPDTPAKKAHIIATKQLMIMRRNKPELFPDFTPPPVDPSALRSNPAGQPAAPQGGAFDGVPANSGVNETTV